MARYFGYRLEDTFGEEKLSNNITYLEMGKCTLDPPKSPNLDIDTIEETESRVKRGLYSPEGELEIALDIPTLKNFLSVCMGNEVTDATTGIIQIYPAGQRKLKSITAYVGKDDGNPNDFEHVFYGTVINKLAIKLSDGVATATISLICQRDGKNSLKSESEIDIADTYPIAFYEAETAMGETDLTARTTSFEWEFNNNVNASNGQAFGNMHPYRLTSSSKDSTVKTTVFYEGYDFLVKFWGSTTGPTCKTTYDDYTIIFTDELDNKLTLHYPKIALDSVPQSVEGKEEIKQELELKILKGKTQLADNSNVRTSVLASIELAETEPAVGP